MGAHLAFYILSKGLGISGKTEVERGASNEAFGGS